MTKIIDLETFVQMTEAEQIAYTSSLTKEEYAEFEKNIFGADKPRAKSYIPLYIMLSILTLILICGIKSCFIQNDSVTYSNYIMHPTAHRVLWHIYFWSAPLILSGLFTYLISIENKTSKLSKRVKLAFKSMLLSFLILLLLNGIITVLIQEMIQVMDDNKNNRTTDMTAVISNISCYDSRYDHTKFTLKLANNSVINPEYNVNFCNLYSNYRDLLIGKPVDLIIRQGYLGYFVDAIYLDGTNVIERN
jgi:hypothetical protein